MKSLDFVVSDSESNVRLDVCVSRKFSRFSRSFVAKFIESGHVLVNKELANKKYITKPGDYVVFSFFENKNGEDIVARNLPLRIVYEDEYLMVVDKSKGMVTHPAPGHYDDTLVNALMFYTSELSDVNSKFRAGIVHRLDKDTSGLLLIAKNNFVHENLAFQIKNRSVKREYVGIVHGNTKFLSGKIDLPIGRDPKNRKKMAVTDKNSKSAVTYYEVIKFYAKYSYMKFSLETGRTHQIRVHMSNMGHPLAGDSLYGAKNDPDFLCGQCLHARKIKFKHPVTGEMLEFSSEPPEYFKKFISIISSES